DPIRYVESLSICIAALGGMVTLGLFAWWFDDTEQFRYNVIAHSYFGICKEPDYNVFTKVATTLRVTDAKKGLAHLRTSYVRDVTKSDHKVTTTKLIDKLFTKLQLTQISGDNDQDLCPAFPGDRHEQLRRDCPQTDPQAEWRESSCEERAKSFIRQRAQGESGSSTPELPQSALFQRGPVGGSKGLGGLRRQSI
ncbi:hypothetical protein HDU91_001970, partial [Kappamyces sp. JEL0680]